MMRIGFHVSGMTHLRYHVPLSDKIHQFFPDFELVFLPVMTGIKYNGLAVAHNLARYREILHERPHVQPIGDDKKLDVLFSVEGAPGVQADRHYAIQHGMDSFVMLKETKEGVTTMVCTSTDTVAIASHLDIPCIVSPIPVCLWNARKDLDLGRTMEDDFILFFYPDRKNAAEANSVISALTREGYKVIVKQRVKHQRVTHPDCTYVLDDFWYPSEAICLPLAARATVGFGSSAYLDLIELGVNYVNVDFRPDKYPWSIFVHPECENYTRITDCTSLNDTIIGAVADKEPINPSQEELDEQIHRFLVELLDG